MFEELDKRHVSEVEKEICDIDLDTFEYPSYTADQFAIFVQNFEDTFNNNIQF